MEGTNVRTKYVQMFGMDLTWSPKELFLHSLRIGMYAKYVKIHYMKATVNIGHDTYRT